MQITPIRDWGEAIMTSMTGALMMFVGALPKVLGFIVILVVGWFVASLIAKAVAGILRNIRFNDFARRSGLGDFVDRTGIQTDPAGVMAAIAKWFIRLITLIVAFDALGLPAVSQVLHQLLLWLPNLVVALVVLVIAGLAANALYNLVRGATSKAGFAAPNLLANIAYVAVWVFGVVVAVNQIGIAETLVNTLFMGFIGALALALGLSFGLGSRETAGEIVREWYQTTRRSSPQIERAANIAQQDARETAREYREYADETRRTDTERRPMTPRDSHGQHRR
jgi:hypothetical protein